MKPSFNTLDADLSNYYRRTQTSVPKKQKPSNIYKGDLVENVQSLFLKQKYLNKKRLQSSNIQKDLRKEAFEENFDEKGNKNTNNSFSPSGSAELLVNQEDSVEFSELSSNTSQFNLLRNISKDTIKLNDD